MFITHLILLKAPVGLCKVKLPSSVDWVAKTLEHETTDKDGYRSVSWYVQNPGLICSYPWLCLPGRKKIRLLTLSSSSSNLSWKKPRPEKWSEWLGTPGTLQQRAMGCFRSLRRYAEPLGPMTVAAGWNSADLWEWWHLPWPLDLTQRLRRWKNQWPPKVNLRPWLSSLLLYIDEKQRQRMESEQAGVVLVRRGWKRWRLQEWKGIWGSCHQGSCLRTHVRSWAMIDVISIKICWFSECIIGGSNGKWEVCIFFACSLDLSRKMTTCCLPYQGLILCLVHSYPFFIDLSGNC